MCSTIDENKNFVRQGSVGYLMVDLARLYVRTCLKLKMIDPIKIGDAVHDGSVLSAILSISDNTLMTQQF